MQMPVPVPLEGPTEKKGFFIHGPIVAVAEVALVFLAIVSVLSVLVRFSSGTPSESSATVGLLPAFIIVLIVLVIVRGFRFVRSDQALVLSAGNRYLGTIRGGGLVWTSPFVTRRKISLQSYKTTVQHPFDGARSMTADVFWKITDTSKAFKVEEYDRSVRKTITDAFNEVGASATLEQFSDALRRHFNEIGVTPTKVELRSGRVAF
jgi:regulator of protease activity HflC (stomatin/prohibitin superfamily)